MPGTGWSPVKGGSHHSSKLLQTPQNRVSFSPLLTVCSSPPKGREEWLALTLLASSDSPPNKGGRG